MKENIKISVVVISAIFLALCSVTSAQNLADMVQEHIRDRIEPAGVPPRIDIGEEHIHASVVLPRFYEQRVYMPAWSNDKGITPQALALTETILEADEEGLIPTDYHLTKIDAVLGEVSANQAQGKPFNPARLADLDLLMTDAFLILGAHLLAGRVDPETLHGEWEAQQREADLAHVLQEAIDNHNVKQALQNLEPPHSDYAQLRRYLALYRNIMAKGGWPMVAEGPTIRKADIDERIPILRKRLIIVDDLAPNKSNGEMFDDDVDQALRRFQERQGLTVDGVLGKGTLAALNTPVEVRVHQIEINMERWRWLPQDLGRRYIIINIANFELDVVENHETVITMPSIVGRAYRRTPVFSDNVTYLVLNPYWFVPHSIATRDILPKVKSNPNYLKQNNYKVFNGWGANAKEINPSTIDWARVTAQNFRYALRQEPGPNNALGRIKFMFPNKYNVYVHDTPGKELFKRTERDFSSGCIRIEKPIELAEYVLRGSPKWSRENILAAFSVAEEQTVRLPESIPVHLLYWTAWVDENGVMQFRNDIYGRDKPVYEALHEKPPSN